MNIFVGLLAIGVIAWTVIYTASYAAWLWGKGYRSGAIGVLILAVLCAVMPAWMWWGKQP